MRTLKSMVVFLILDCVANQAKPIDLGSWYVIGCQIDESFRGNYKDGKLSTIRRIGETTGRFALLGEYWCGRCWSERGHFTVEPMRFGVGSEASMARRGAWEVRRSGAARGSWMQSAARTPTRTPSTPSAIAIRSPAAATRRRAVSGCSRAAARRRCRPSGRTRPPRPRSSP